MTDPALNPFSGVRRRLVPLLAAVTVLAVLFGAGFALRGWSPADPGGASPPVLRLADYREPTVQDSADDQFRLAAQLPDGPPDAAVRWLRPPERSEVERLARALGIRGDLTRGVGATTYLTDAASLRVQQRAGGEWRYVRADFSDGSIGCPDGPGPVADITVSCDVAEPVPLGDDATSTGVGQASGGAARVVAITTPQGARAAARPVLEAVGIDPGDAAVRADLPEAIVLGEPTVEDLPTEGLTTSVTVSGTQVIAANGWLGRSRAGATYPVISALAAWHQLLRTPQVRPMMACPEPVPAERDPMLCGEPITVTGARFGLTMNRQNGQPLLVPSWHFDVRGSERPLSVVAVDPRYLAAPPVATAGGADPGAGGSVSGGSVSGGSGSGGSGSGGSGSGGSTGTGAPDPSAPQPVATNSRFSSVTTNDPGTELLVHFTGGVRACYSYSVIATETEARVSLSLVERAASNMRCMDLAQVYERRVPLGAALGTRRVVDAGTGAVLLGPSR